VPLLDAGRYRLQFDYHPQWSDPVLKEADVGRVRSNEVVLTVTESAPPTVSRRGVEASLAVAREGGMLLARLINRTDQTILVNRNFGTSPPFAVGRWVYDGDGRMRELSMSKPGGKSWHDFDRAELKPVPPGESIELTRIPVAQAQRELIDRGAPVDDGTWELYYTYSSLCDRSWQKRQGDTLLGNESAPDVFRTLLPRRLLAGWHTSNRIELSGQRHDHTGD
jgi:hypothetical protein